MKLLIQSRSHWNIIVICFINLALLSGCAVFFPAHPKSGDREKEDVKVERAKILTVDQLHSKIYPEATSHSPEQLGNLRKIRNGLTHSFIECLQNKIEWKSCTENNGKKENYQTLFAGLEVAVAAASVIIGLGVDAAADAIKDEGSKHEANFGRKGIEKNFWVKNLSPELGCIDKNKPEDTDPPVVKTLDNCDTSFDFIRITRSTERSSSENPAFELILYFEEKNKEFFVYPVRYITRSAKAKVLEPWCNPFDYRDGFEGLGCAIGYIPPLIAIKFFQDSKSSIQTNALVSMDGHWRTPDQKGHSDNINSILFTVSDYSINNYGGGTEPEMKVFGEKGNVDTPISWANAIPVSQKESGILTSNGTYTLEVKVGEIDQAKVEKMTKAFSGFLTDNKEKITSEIMQKVSGGDSKKN